MSDPLSQSVLSPETSGSVPAVTLTTFPSGLLTQWVSLIYIVPFLMAARVTDEPVTVRIFLAHTVQTLIL